MGLVPMLGELGPGAIVYQDGLAKLLGKHPVSVKRAVDRGELPHPIKLLGRFAWTAGVLVKFLERRQEEAAKEAERQARRLEDLRP